jgi:integrase
VFVSHLKRRLHRGLLPIPERADLPEDYTPHQLRHICATLLLYKRGVHPKFVQELLGHATFALTLDGYSHWIPSMGVRVAELTNVERHVPLCF